jgi:hypothetical protein
VAIRALLPHGTWQTAGGFCLAVFVLAALAGSLGRAPGNRS